MASIQKRGNGRWRARYRDAAGKEHAKHFGRKVDAQRWLDEVTADVVTGRYVHPRAGDVTFSDWMARWAELQVWQPRTATQADLIRRKATFGDLPLSKITTSHVEAFKRHMVAEGYAPNTVNNRLTIVRSVFKAAVRDRLIGSNPADGVKGVRIDARSKEMQIPTPEQVAALMEASGPRMISYLALGAFAGLRLGEISGTKVEDVDFLRRTLHVRRQVQARPGGPPEVREPKYGSVRDVYIPDELVTMLSRHVEVQGVSSEGWLFFTGGGRPLPPSTVNYWWLRTCQAAGVEGLNLHSLRHFYASGLIAAGCDVVTVQRALGHSKPSTTLDTYSHLWPSAEDRTRAAAAELVGSVHGHVAAVPGVAR